MAPQKLRTQVAAFAISVGLLVLLAGPTSTFGLSVPGADTTTSQVTGTVQGAVQTTQQVADTTVTQVQSTVQPTVETTTQAVAAPAPSAPAAAPVQTTTQKVASAPKQVATPVAAPAKKRVAVAAPTTTAPRAPSPPAAAPPSPRTVVATRTASPSHRTGVTRHATARPASSTGASPVQCDVPLLNLLPGVGQLSSLLTLACDAVNSLDLPSRVGLAPSSASDNPLLGDLLLPASSSAPPARKRARSSAAGGRPPTTGRHGAASAADGAGLGGRGALPLVAVGVGHGGPVAYVDSFRTPVASAGHVAAGHSSASDPRHHHAWFSGQSRGTEILMAILFASLSVLGGIILWRLAVRWVIPRFA